MWRHHFRDGMIARCRWYWQGWSTTVRKRHVWTKHWLTPWVMVLWCPMMSYECGKQIFVTLSLWIERSLAIQWFQYDWIAANSGGQLNYFHLTALAPRNAYHFQMSALWWHYPIWQYWYNTIYHIGLSKNDVPESIQWYDSTHTHMYIYICICICI